MMEHDPAMTHEASVAMAQNYNSTIYALALEGKKVIMPLWG